MADGGQRTAFSGRTQPTPMPTAGGRGRTVGNGRTTNVRNVRCVRGENLAGENHQRRPQALAPAQQTVQPRIQRLVEAGHRLLQHALHPLHLLADGL